ncbi:MAG: hypothetical protein OIF38_01350 [Cellvibrionaceae bacterium]|nr:hypothetical protein [Cellvibrionaceae bacterium]
MSKKYRMAVVILLASLVLLVNVNGDHKELGQDPSTTKEGVINSLMSGSQAEAMVNDMVTVPGLNGKEAVSEESFGAVKVTQLDKFKAEFRSMSDAQRYRWMNDKLLLPGTRLVPPVADSELKDYHRWLESIGKYAHLGYELKDTAYGQYEDKVLYQMAKQV